MLRKFTFALFFSASALLAQDSDKKSSSEQPATASQPAGGRIRDDRVSVENVSFWKKNATDGKGDYLEVTFDIMNKSEDAIPLKMFVIAFNERDLVDKEYRRFVEYPKWRVFDEDKKMHKLVLFDSIPATKHEDVAAFARKKEEAVAKNGGFKPREDADENTGPKKKTTLKQFLQYVQYVHENPNAGVDVMLQGYENTTAIAMLLDANASLEDMASIKLVSGGSAHLDPDLQERFEQRYGIPILWAMGATEFCGTIVRWTPQMREQVGNSKRGSIGLPMPGVEIKVVDPDTGEEVPAGTEGLMEVHCPAVRPDWVRTTDLVYVDEDGYVFHRGRYDGAIVRGGFKILPERVVDVLRSHPSVADASVVGMPDARLGEVPVAAVELLSSEPRVDAQALLDHVRANMPPTHVPARLLIVEALPRTPSLKVSLTDVKRLFDEAIA